MSQRLLVPFRPSKSAASALSVCVALLSSAGALSGQEAGDDWPREIEVDAASIILYQPQVESFEGNDLSARTAVSVTLAGANEPTFGVVWMTARVETDRDARMVNVLDVNVDRMSFPGSTEEQETAFASLLEREIPAWELSISLDRLLTSLDLAEQERVAASDLRSEPPTIVFATEPTVLVSIDGEPRMQEAGDGLTRVLNTPFTVVLASDPSRYFLNAGEESWYSAGDLIGPWTLTTSVPAAVAALAPEPPEDLDLETEDPEPGPPPTIMVATEPTELIVTEGAPEYAPITGTDLLYVTNSESDVLLEVSAQSHYVILSGRWFSSESMNGPWVHVAPEDMPSTFSDISPASEMGHLLISIPGTEEANEAIMDHQVPQTSAIQRSATLEVTYDGEPQFEAIEGTEMAYAINTSTSVIRVDGSYMAVDNAVWYVADRPEGPWRVAESVPDEVYTMPASSPVYNVKYVYVFDTTPDVVYMGYYPGYMHSYVYGGTIVYGTGYYYTPWYGSYYYPAHSTWGWHVRYNPWYGWSYGFSYSTGPFTFAIGWGGGYHGWWGPVGYRGYGAGYHRGWHDGYRRGVGAGYRAGFRAGTRLENQRSNIYDRPSNVRRNAARPAAGDRRQLGTATGRDNNVFADRAGDVHRRTDQGWETRRGNEWERSDRAGAARPGAANARTRTEGLDRSRQARDRGTARTRNFQQSGARRGSRRR